MNSSAFLFETAEQTNRRIAFRAALDLALRNPTYKITDEAINQYQNEYNSLVNPPVAGGHVTNVGPGKFTPAEARAIITAAHVVDQTQYVYARYARPKIFQGRIRGTVFVFKRYLQATLTMLGQNPRVVPYYVLMATLLGGAGGGLPGYDDLKEIIRALGWVIGKKDWNIERELREWITHHFDEKKIPPDLILHGLSRYGFGIPALLDAMGSSLYRDSGKGVRSYKGRAERRLSDTRSL